MSSTIEQLRDSLLQELRSDPTSVANVIEKLKSATDEGQLVDPANDSSCHQAWGAISLTLLRSGLANQAVDIGKAWYNHLNKLQVKHTKRYHKGSPAYNLGVCYLQLGDLGRAFWFHVCAFIEDVLSTPGSATPQHPATQVLRVHFNWSEEHFDIVAAAARKAQKELGSRWRFPETTIVLLARRGEFANHATSSADVPINQPFLNELIESLPVEDNSQKQESLEFLASYLAITLPGMRIKANVKAFEHGATCEHEIDLVATQYGSAPTYLLEALGRHFFD